VYENRLAEVRLGLASSLFLSLRAKHGPTAAHCLRVALGCSAWSFALEFEEQQRDELEVAALLHDVGKIGVPDTILLKPGKLLGDEATLMNRHRLAGLDILRTCCTAPGILEIVRHAPAWYDGSRRDYPMAGNNLPLGARILAIVDAYDSMTTDQVYRRALSRERALAELYGGAGTQFDPDLIKVFSLLHDSPQLQEKVSQRWLHGLDPRASHRLWQWNPTVAPAVENSVSSLFQHKLLENMHDAVVFVDRTLRITLWNRGAERLTGISANSVDNHSWVPSLVKLCDDRGADLRDDECPVSYAIQTGVQSLRRLSLNGRNGRSVQVDLHAVPVVDKDGTTHGATIVLHDASPEASLEKRCQSLHERATKDPLTQVANRAEFDRTHDMFVAAHLERRLPCSLVICDIDHFKRINDTFGHPAGDEALKSFASLLKSFCRSGDLVARYGGEEFVFLCADCNNATAADRAEEIRRSIAGLAQPALNGQCITASFGVTEVQNGDTPATMLRRADRALLEAKQRGRNMVMQLGSGIGELEEPTQRRWWFQRRGGNPLILLEKWLVTPVPLQVAVEKLRGFVVDHFAEITSVDGENILLKLECQKQNLLRRSGDRPIPFLVELRFSEGDAEKLAADDAARKKTLRTHVYVAIRPKRDRDRRRSDAQERARLVMSSIKAYLMATEEPSRTEPKPDRRVTDVLSPLMRKKR
jgi:diguanylate cyclase (GGDEF)-like protein/PAS domain S-box-containing protein